MRAFAFTFMTLALAACGSSTDGQGTGGAGGAQQLPGSVGESAGGNDSSAGGAGGAQQLSGSAGENAGGNDSSAGGAGGAQQLSGSAGESAGGDDSSAQCFPCEGYWICGGDVRRIDLVPEAGGCLLSGLPGRNLLSPDGTITADEVIVGKAQGTGARVHVAYPDGSQWLFCGGEGGPCP